MWNSVRFTSNPLMRCSKWITESRRTTYVFRRTREIPLNRLNAKFPRKLKRPSYYYEVIDWKDNTDNPQLDLVLLKDIPGLGMIGETITTDYYTGYHELLLPKLAIYASLPEAKEVSRTKEEVQHSSIYSKIVGNHLTGLALPVYLSQETKWTLQPWHIKLALRKAGVMTQEDCIILPQKEISGPDPSVENKDFVIKLIMNKTETFKIRCRIYHLTNESQSENQNFDIMDSESKCLFPEEEETVQSLIHTRQAFQKTKLLNEKLQYWNK